MSRICDVTGKKSLKGNQVSHAMNHTIIHQQANLHKKRFWLTAENRWVKLKVSTRAIRTINKNGIAAVLKEIKKAK